MKNYSLPMASAVVSTQAAAESVILAEIRAGVLVDYATIEGVEILARLSRAQNQPFLSPG